MHAQQLTIHAEPVAENTGLSWMCISFSVFCVEVLIIRCDKMVSHMTPTCAFVFVIRASDPGKDLPYFIVRHVYIVIG